MLFMIQPLNLLLEVHHMNFTDPLCMFLCCKCQNVKLSHVSAGLGSVNLQRKVQSEKNVTELKLMKNVLQVEETFD